MRPKKTFIFIFSVLLTGCSSDEKEREVSPRVVKVIETNQQSDIISRRFVGRVDALNTVDLSFQVGGRLSEFPAIQGGVIPEGELVARLEQTDYALALRKAEAESNLARRDMQRKRNLLAHNAVSQSVFDEAQTNFELSEVQLESARQDLSYTTIRAPFDALVTRRLTDLHSNIQPNEQVVRVQDVTELRIRMSAPEALIQYVANSDRFEIEAELLAMPGHRIPLEYREHVTEPDEVAQTYEVEFALIDDTPLVALPGMTATVFISLADDVMPPVIMIPVSAVAKDEAGNFHVWRYNTDEKTVTSQQVALGEISGDSVPVISGLERGTTIVVAGLHLLRDGMPVQPLEQAL
ncbi:MULTISPECIES: efflux RND transporter periplasmic adaptor subunit [Halomonadaceae]|uniref:Toluene efflux pump periplasmic linker protein TtgG n=1 Tax=Vreelandella titanicae TaxID=664683 RepID=A0AAP9T161_9GAMM|nr:MULTISPECIES: efflux RND transporter periplasmic adaptor subunit [Halomonas]QKS25519.1 Toluene efflux pump periplasmic linker protein TtgG [Halomonas titanicae]CDG53282.1 Efflux transporter, RND family, MFP subunit [Halomonas sp. A3H3]SDJ09499.1 RND family efflux transporter, MFP subunit [Halomonas titanicae]|tara:strand:+ start:2323 stop:3375 length:1053 start_codon:yes stop_codon:yes gene_type:complete